MRLVALGAVTLAVLFGLSLTFNSQSTTLASVDESEALQIAGGCDTYEINSAEQVCGDWGGGIKFWEYCSSVSMIYLEANDPNAYYSVAGATCTTSCGYACGTKNVLVPCTGGSSTGSGAEA